MTKTQAKITNRLSPCRCGCKGGDPWHARSFKRTVRDVREVAPGTREGTKACPSLPFFVLREGVAKFPWGAERVVEVKHGWYQQVWEGEEFVRLDWVDSATATTGGWWIAADKESE